MTVSVIGVKSFKITETLLAFMVQGPPPLRCTGASTKQIRLWSQLKKYGVGDDKWKKYKKIF